MKIKQIDPVLGTVEARSGFRRSSAISALLFIC
jgi:hypothetical protein